MVSLLTRALHKAKSYPLRTAGLLFLCGLAVIVTIIHHRINSQIAPPGDIEVPSGGKQQQQPNLQTSDGKDKEIEVVAPPKPEIERPKPTTKKPTPPTTPKPHPPSRPYLSNLKPLLVITGVEPVPNRYVLTDFLDQMRMRYDVHPVTSLGVDFVDYIKEDYGAFVFERLGVYTKMLNDNNTAVHRYCKSHGVGIVTFASVHDNEAYGENLRVSLFPLHAHRDTTLQDYQINADATLRRITKNGGLIKGHLNGKWAVFVPDHVTYVPLAYAKTQTNFYVNRMGSITYTTAVQDTGAFDGIKRVIFGQGLEFWMHRLLFLDALTYVSANNIRLPLDRFLSVDIDDVFMDYNGRKMKEDDVTALITFQREIANMVPGFKFNMGYIGNMFETGTEQEKMANKKLVENSDLFWWYDNTFDRLNIRDLTAKAIADNIEKNQKFAKDNEINVTQYAVSANYFGVYPLYPPLYEAWVDKGISSTSTSHVSRGFVYKGVKVLPRSTFKMFNKNIFLANAQEIFRSVEGGDAFNDILCNPINIYMSYFCNYGMDRVAHYAIARLLNFVRKWTKLRLYSESSGQIANRYFTLFPNDIEPLWADPCRDKMYMPDDSLCDHQPQVLLVGPSITGSETLKSLLMRNSQFGINKKQLNYFSDDKIYTAGTDEYFDQFPKQSDSLQHIMDYDTDYFSAEKVPMRVRSFLPDTTKIIIVLARPEVVAKECFETSKATVKLAFIDAIKKNPPHACVQRGMYADHLRRWLSRFHSVQILVVDGNSIYSDSINTMNRVQDFIGVRERYDYKGILTLNSKTGVYCSASGCLGDNEIPYRTLGPYEKGLLQNIYVKQSMLLAGLLRGMRQPVPPWAVKP